MLIMRRKSSANWIKRKKNKTPNKMALLKRYLMVITEKDHVKLAVRPFIHKYGMTKPGYSLLTNDFKMAARFDTYDQVKAFAAKFGKHCKDNRLSMRWRIIYISSASGRAINT